MHPERARILDRPQRPMEFLQQSSLQGLAPTIRNISPQYGGHQARLLKVRKIVIRDLIVKRIDL